MGLKTSSKYPYNTENKNKRNHVKAEGDLESATHLELLDIRASPEVLRGGAANT